MPKKKDINHNTLEEMKKLYEEEKKQEKQPSAEKPLKIKESFEDAFRKVIHKKG